MTQPSAPGDPLSRNNIAIHAERLALDMFYKRGGLLNPEHCILYVTHGPCVSCARDIIESRIRYVVIGDGACKDTSEDSLAMFAEAGVKVCQLTP